MSARSGWCGGAQGWSVWLPAAQASRNLLGAAGKEG
jgi:hypothetical protein